MNETGQGLTLSAPASIEEIAASARVSVNTVRTQVRALLAKTGRRRQAEIVALIAGLKIGRDADG